MLRPGRITLVGSSSANGSSTAVSMATPSGGQPGDRLYTCVHYNNTPSITDNNGAAPTTLWSTTAPYTASFSFFYRTLTGAEGANTAYTLGTSQRWTVVGWILRGAHPFNIFEVPPVIGNVNTGGGGAFSTISAPGVQAWSDGSWAFALGGIDSGLISWSAMPSAPWTTLVNAGGANNTIGVSYQEMVVSGTTDATFTKNNDVENAATFTVFTVAAAPVPTHPFNFRRVAAVG